MTRTCALAVAALALLAPSRTRADSGGTMTVIDRADRAIARMMPVLFDNTDVAQRSLPAPSGARHSLTLGEISIHVLPRIAIHFGAGLAAIVDAPTDSRLPRTGFATVAGASLAIFEPAGFRVGVEVNTLHVRYGSAGVTDQTMMLALTTR
jgi:hypothetical protein